MSEEPTTPIETPSEQVIFFTWWGEKEKEQLENLERAWQETATHIKENNQQPPMDLEGGTLSLAETIRNRLDNEYETYKRNEWGPELQKTGISIDLGSYPEGFGFLTLHRESAVFLEALGFDIDQLLGGHYVPDHYYKEYQKLRQPTANPWVPAGRLGDSSILVEFVPISAIPKVTDELEVSFTESRLRLHIDPKLT